MDCESGLLKTYRPNSPQRIAAGRKRIPAWGRLLVRGANRDIELEEVLTAGRHRVFTIT